STAGFVNGENISLATSPLSITTMPATSNAGSYAITGSGLTIGNYQIQYVNGSLTITPVALTVNVASKSMTYGSALPTLTYSLSGLVNDDTAANLGSSPVLTTVSVNSGVGIYAITANGLTTTNYNVAYSSGCLTINRACLTITADNKTMTYGGNLPALTANYSGLVNGDTVANLASATLLNTVSATSGAGSYTITPYGAVSDNYDISHANGTLSILKANLTITADNKSVMIGRSMPALTASYSGLVNGDTTDRLTNLPIVSASANSIVIGNFPITVSGAASPNYNFNYVSGTLAVTRQSTQTSVAASVASPAINQSVTFTATITTTDTMAAVTSGSVTFRVDGNVIGSPVALDSNGTASFTNSTLGAGHHTILAEFAGDSVSVASNQTLAVDVAAYATSTSVVSSYSTFKAGCAANLTTTVTGVGSGVPTPTGTVQFIVNGSAFGSPVALNGSGQATSTSLASLPTGTHSVSVTFVDATSVYQSSSGSTSFVIVTAYSQSIAISPTGPFTYGDSPVALSATANSGLPVALSFISGPGSLSGENLTIAGAGSIVVSATQTGDYLYDPVTVNQTLTINQANLIFTSLDASKAYGQASPLNNLTGYSLTGSLFHGDTIASINLTSCGSAPTANVGIYSITPASLVLANTGIGNIANYNITYVSSGNLTVSQAPITITASDRTKRFGDSLAIGTSCFTTNGTLYHGDTIAAVTLVVPRPPIARHRSAITPLHQAPLLLALRVSVISRITISPTPMAHFRCWNLSAQRSR
ncbi:MAG: MBG domain-containing protein, partial [bacterium]